jgi:hypothetical protein
MFIIHRQQTKTDLTRLSAATTNGSVSAGTKVSLNPQPDVTNNAFPSFIFIVRFIPASSGKMTR